MKTKKQEELVNSFLSMLGDEIRPAYQDIAFYLDGLGYNPRKEKSNISFKHDLHNKQIAKMGMRKGDNPFFALRFSACRGFSKRFEDIVSAEVTKYPARFARCVDGGCDYCAGEAVAHVYCYTFPDGKVKSNCGAYALPIPDITAGDEEEIKKLIKEEHEFLLKHEAGKTEG